MSNNSNHAQALTLELEWISHLINQRISSYFQPEKGIFKLESVSPPVLPSASNLAKLHEENNLSIPERIILALAIIPNLKPQLLDNFCIKNKALDRGFSEFGGIFGDQHGGFLPTAETALFLLSGGDLNQRIGYMESLAYHGALRKSGILKMGKSPTGEPVLSAPIFIDDHVMEYLQTGQEYTPEMSAEFPAKIIDTSLEWDDLVLDEEVLNRIEEVKSWVVHEKFLLEEWGLSRKLKKGFRCLFYGPPGTGKTLTASLLGKATGMPVYRVDLSLVVSKYIGETEKNLSRIFDMAEHKKWILFFDEADALFGKRVQTSSSNDRFANQEIAFLLQRIEDFDGLIILASNIKGNIDEAFARRFQSMIYFPLPEKEERLLLWKSYFNGNLPIDPDIDFKPLADEYELSGGNIVNILRFSCIKAVEREHQQVQEEDIVEGLRREFRQLGRTV
ncbi:MAG: ATP-binding protein [Reichenbachiella sp.]|uniref:ATP-binding protein n=1 Tax=Reichenbachiella sp. TaxID=2184521 RepID=UPI003262F19D